MAGNAMTIEAQLGPVSRRAPTPSSIFHPPSSIRRWLLLLAAALVSSGLLWLSYFPVNCGWLGWIALVPLLFLVQSTVRPWRIYLAAWISGLAFYWPVLQWLRVADPMMYYTWGALATYCSLYVPLAIWLVRRFEHGTRLPLVVTVPVVWTALDFFRANFMGGFATTILGTTQHDYLGGFAWYFLGHTQHDFLPIIQIADLAGAYGVTFVVVAVNALVFELLCSWPMLRRTLSLAERQCYRGPRDWVWQTAAIALLVGVTFIYGAWRLGQSEFEQGPRLALIQGNLEQRIRNAAPLGGQDIARTIYRHYEKLSDDAIAGQSTPQLIVWPETSFPGSWPLLGTGVDAGQLSLERRKEAEVARESAIKLAYRWKTDILLGTQTEVFSGDDPARIYNSALLIEKTGRAGARYDKIHRVPFGEYVPFHRALPWLNTFAPYDYDYSVQAGEQWTRLPLGKFHFGVIICYEDTDPMLARQYVRTDRGEPAVDFLINISNDGWFSGTAEHEQHLAICRFRAVECRRAVARAVNMGISAVIDGNGRIVALPAATWGESKKIAAVLAADVPLDRRSSLYAVWGDWLPVGCWLFIGLGLAYPFGRRVVARKV